jgi:hypothetical protein
VGNFVISNCDSWLAIVTAFLLKLHSFMYFCGPINDDFPGYRYHQSSLVLTESKERSRRLRKYAAFFRHVYMSMNTEKGSCEQLSRDSLPSPH